MHVGQKVEAEVVVEAKALRAEVEQKQQALDHLMAEEQDTKKAHHWVLGFFLVRAGRVSLVRCAAF